MQRISVSQAVQLINEDNALVVDIRDPGSFANGHVENATRIDNSNFQAYLQSADKTRPLLVFCYHGNSSQQAAQVFYQQGFEQAYSVDGGMSEWAMTQPVISGD
jgi:thiosulfate sulfurtransferase